MVDIDIYYDIVCNNYQRYNHNPKISKFGGERPNYHYKAYKDYL